MIYVNTIWSIVQIPFQTRWQMNFSNARGILPFPCGSLGKASGFALARTAESLHFLYQIAGHTIGMPRNLAQREGFEPPEALTSIVFKSPYLIYPYRSLLIVIDDNSLNIGFSAFFVAFCLFLMIVANPYKKRISDNVL